MANHQEQKSSSEHLSILLRLSQYFNSSLDLDEVLSRVMDEVIKTTRAERGFVMLRESGEKSDDLVFRVARGIDQRTIDDPQFQISRSVVDRVAHEGEPLLTSNAQDDSRLSGRQSVMLLGLRSILCVPLKIKDQITGVIYVDNRLQAGIFNQADLELLNGIAASAAIAIENARLYQVAVEKGRMERELQMAYKVQTSLLPEKMPSLPGWDIAAYWQPAREVAGDYYDFVDEPDGRQGILIADVTDKGMPAALFMAFTRSIIRANVKHTLSPAESIIQANRLICAESHESLFVTLVYARLDLALNRLIYVNAGHNQPLCYHAKSGEITPLETTGIPLGIDEDSKFEEKTLQLDPGDLIIFYTDGITEAINQFQEEFGSGRLEQLVMQDSEASAAQLITSLRQSVEDFTHSTDLSDDITIVVVKRERN